MPGTVAITRGVVDAIARCELTHLVRAPIDVALARSQHADYRAALEGLGCEILELEAPQGLADGVFVEDAAVVVDELAVIARPGARSRRAEVPSVAAALARLRPCLAIEAPGTLDGGDVLRAGRRLYVGLGARTNASGARQLARAVEPHGYEVVAVTVSRCLHLKSAVTALDAHTVLVNPGWVDVTHLGGMDRIEVDPGEPFAANALAVGGAVVYPREHRRTAARLAAHGLEVVPVAASEVAKAEGAVTCCSILVERSTSGSGNVPGQGADPGAG